MSTTAAAADPLREVLTVCRVLLLLCASPCLCQSRLLYAARNCAGIDADDTMEGRANMGMTVSDSDSD